MNRTLPDKDILDRIARATGLREGAAGVADILRAIHRLGPGPLNRVAREARLPVPVASAVRRELETAGLCHRKGGVGLTETGQAFVDRHLGLGQQGLAVQCGTCDGRGLAPLDPALLARFKAHLARVPGVDVTLDQAPCTPETALNRAMLMLHAGALEGRRILILGDDDAVSLAILLVRAQAGLPALPAPITVVELDPNWGTFLSDAAAREGGGVEVVAHDLREPLPEAISGSFDVVETDPPYTLEGARLFLTRARQALCDDSGTLGFFSYAQQDPDRQAALLRAVGEAGFTVTAMMPAFNRYQGAAVLGGVGQMIQLAGVGQAPDGGEPYAGPLYTAEVNPRERRYRCTACGATISLGRDGAPATVEALKATGCPQCGGGVFRRLSGRAR